jgi:hypothetical protein
MTAVGPFIYPEVLSLPPVTAWPPLILIQVRQNSTDLLQRTSRSPCQNRWKVASGGKFGYSVQRDIWNQQQKRWDRFIKQLGWVAGINNIYLKWPAEFIYSIDAPRGHLPLTNALRGTQVRRERRGEEGGRGLAPVLG